MTNQFSNVFSEFVLRTFRFANADNKKISWSDLRNGLVKLAVPNEREHLADVVVPMESGPYIVAPGFGVHSPGETAKG